MSLFLKDQLERTVARILEITEENKELSKLLQQRNTIINQLKEIDDEFEKNPNVDLFTEIIMSTQSSLDRKTVKRKPKTFLEFLLAVTEELAQAMIIKIK